MNNFTLNNLLSLLRNTSNTITKAILIRPQQHQQQGRLHISRVRNSNQSAWLYVCSKYVCEYQTQSAIPMQLKRHQTRKLHLPVYYCPIRLSSNNNELLQNVPYIIRVTPKRALHHTKRSALSSLVIMWVQLFRL